MESLADGNQVKIEIENTEVNNLFENVNENNEKDIDTEKVNIECENCESVTIDIEDGLYSNLLPKDPQLETGDTLVKVSISDKISRQEPHLYFLMHKDLYFHVGYAAKINSGSTHNIKFQKTVSL